MAKDYIEIQRDLGGGEKEGCRSGVMIICSLRMYVCMCVCGCMAKESMKNWEACVNIHALATLHTPAVKALFFNPMQITPPTRYDTIVCQLCAGEGILVCCCVVAKAEYRV